MLGFLPTRAYRPGTPGATTFLSPLSGTFNYGWDSFVYPPAEQLKRARDHFVDVVAEVETGGASRAKVDEAKDTLLEKSRAYNASGPGYVKDFELIQESLKRLAMPSSFDSEEPSRQESEEEDPGK